MGFEFLKTRGFSAPFRRVENGGRKLLLGRRECQILGGEGTKKRGIREGALGKTYIRGGERD